MTDIDKKRLEDKINHPSRYQDVNTNILLSSLRLFEAADLLIRAYERRIEANGEAFKHEMKQMFTGMSKNIKSLKYYVEQFVNLYSIAYGDTTGEFYNHMQNVAYWFAAMALQIGDKVYSPDDMNDILKFISDNYISSEHIDDDILTLIKPK